MWSWISCWISTAVLWICVDLFFWNKEKDLDLKELLLWENLHALELKKCQTPKGVREFDAFVGVLLDLGQGLVGFVEVLIQYNIFEL